MIIDIITKTTKFNDIPKTLYEFNVILKLYRTFNGRHTLNISTLLLIFALLFLPIASADALQQVAGKLEVQINPGQSDMVQWGLISDDKNKDIDVKISSKGDGSEFLSFAKSYTIGSSGLIMVPVTVSIPADYPGNITLNPRLYATETGELGSATVINVQMLKIVTLNIMPNDDPDLWVNWEKINIQEMQLEDTLQDEKISSAQGGLLITTPKEMPTCGKGTEFVDGMCQVTKSKESGGGCLIATAIYGTEMAPQIQMLREIRDNTVMGTASGGTFMDAFNKVYYSFSPTLADMQREYPLLKEITKVYLTPMMYILPMMGMAENGSDVQVVTLGVSVIILNVAIYIATPAIITRGIYTRFKVKQLVLNEKMISNQS